MSQGVLLVVCGPSGVGKGTICKQLLNCEDNMYISVSVTTRQPRPTELDGQHYFFVAKDQFNSMISQAEFLEWAQVHSNYYGTLKEPVIQALNKGRDVLLEIDVQGALQVKRNFNDAVLVFVLPPDQNELERRIRSRGTETEEIIAQRLLAAKQEISQINKFDYAIINDTVERSCNNLQAVLQAERLKVKRIF